MNAVEFYYRKRIAIVFTVLQDILYELIYLLWTEWPIRKKLLFKAALAEYDRVSIAGIDL